MHALSLLKAVKIVIMDATKPVVVVSWAVFGLALLVVAAGRWRRPPADWRPATGAGLITAAAILLVRYTLTGSGTLIALTLGSALMFGIARAMGRLGGTQTQAVWMPAAVITVVTSLAWWTIEPGWPDLIRTGAFAAILATVCAGLRDRPAGSRFRAGITALCLAAGGVVLVNMAPVAGDPLGLALLAHHWGAYIGSAQHVQAGLVPFYDIPMQYGLGPTSLVAGACAVVGCWQGLHVLIVVTSLVMALLLLQMMWATSQPRGTLWHVTAAAVTFAAVFLWPGFVAFGSGQVITPSIGGLRFLPLTLVAWCLFSDRPRWAGVALVPAILWSPEVAVWSLTVFVVHEAARLGLARAVWRGAALVGLTGLCFVSVYRTTYGLWPQWDVLGEYVLHVPGPLGIDASGPFLVLVTVFGLGAWLVFRPAANALARRRDLIAVSLLFATTSYFLGRSHPNNVSALMPFLVLVAFRVIDRPRDLHATPLSRLTAIGLAASVATLALSGWRIVPWGHGFDPGMRATVESISAIDADMQALRAGIVNPDHLGIADFGLSLNRAADETVVWTPMDPVSLWAYLPAGRRRLYVSRAAARLHRPGWAIFSEPQLYLLDDLRAAYDVTESSTGRGVTEGPDGTRGVYTVVKLVPR
jgi:hypothetical protein